MTADGLPEIAAASEALTGWDKVWTDVRDTDWGMHYTVGEPRSIAQLEQRGYFEDLWRLLGSRAPTARYLELGAGRGTTATYLAERRCDVTMVDTSSSAFDLARSNFESLGFKQHSYVMADARKTGLRAESWDCVYSIGLLEHFEDPFPILEESARLLRPGGLIFHVIVPTLPRSHSLPVQLTFNPIYTSLRILKRALLSGRTHERSSVTIDSNGVLRTDYSQAQYLDWMKRLPVHDVECQPYNAYHQIYGSLGLERAVTMRLYRWHYAFKRSIRSKLTLGTLARVSRCYLLTATKNLGQTVARSVGGLLVAGLPL